MPRKKHFQWQADKTYSPTADMPSRSAKKRESLALQKLGEALTQLAPQEVREIGVPADLVEALDLYARIRDHEGRRRQLQYIGRLMRGIDPAPIRTALEARNAKKAAAASALHTAEQWRRRLLEASAGELHDILLRMPYVPLMAMKDAKKGSAVPSQEDLLSLIQAARAEVHEHKAPHAQRALFRALHSLLTQNTMP